MLGSDAARALGKAPAPNRPTPALRPDSSGLYREEITWLGTSTICGVRFSRLLVETPDPPVAAALKQPCHRPGIRRAVRSVAKRFRNCADLRDSNRSRILQAEVGRALTAYFRPLASAPISPLRVTFVVVPPPAPRIGRPRLGGVPPRPRGAMPRPSFRGCASCSTDPEGSGRGADLGLVAGLVGVLGWLWTRRG